MIPAAFVAVNAVPRTPNGKVDPQALLAFNPERPASASECVVPQDLLQLQIQGIWEELLPIRPIGIRDNFFELGGHSLLAAQMMTRLGKACGKRLPLAPLLGGTTIEDLARLNPRPGRRPTAESTRGNPEG